MVTRRFVPPILTESSRVQVADSTDVEFVVSVGDAFYPKGVTSIDDPQFGKKWGRMYSRGRLGTLDWYNVLGDHDCYGNTSAIVRYGAVRSRGRFRMGLNNGQCHARARARVRAGHRGSCGFV